MTENKARELIFSVLKSHRPCPRSPADLLPTAAASDRANGGVGNGTANVWPPQLAARSADEITSIKLMATGYTGQAVESS